MRELATLVQAGFELDQALQFTGEARGSRGMSTLLRELRAELREGASLADALARRPGTFDAFFVAMVRAGEVSGQIGPAMDQLATALERSQKLRGTLVSALTYPALVCVVATGSVAFLLTRVVPQFAPLVAQSGRPMPADLAWLLWLGDHLSSYGLAVLAGLVALGLAVRVALRRPGLRLIAERVLLALPFAGDLVRASEAARFGQTLGSLLSRGGELMTALPVARDVLATRHAAAAVTAARSELAVGRSFSEALGAASAFPPAFIHMAMLGERTGKLGAMLLAAAEAQDLVVQQASARLVSLVTPLVTLAMGGAVAAIVSAIVTAMLGLNDAVL